jgi:hypothetical protein
MFQVFHLDVTKIDLRCFICCNDNIGMLEAYILSVLGVSDVCSKCFISMLHILLWLHMHVSSVCLKCFGYFGLML